MQQSCTYGSVRGAPGNRRSYRDKTAVDDEFYALHVCKSEVQMFTSAFGVVVRRHRTGERGHLPLITPAVAASASE
jgi:hypothetical protein